jgi:hypothetical protein
VKDMKAGSYRNQEASQNSNNLNQTPCPFENAP